MRAVLQRVTRASVTVDGAVVGQIDAGLVVLLGVELWFLSHAFVAIDDDRRPAAEPVEPGPASRASGGGRKDRRPPPVAPIITRPRQ